MRFGEVSCPRAWYQFQVKSGNETGSPIIEDTPLFDPDSSYHETLPMVLRLEDQPAVERRSERGGSLISIPLDAEQEIDQGYGRIRAGGSPRLQGTVRAGNRSAQGGCGDKKYRDRN